MTDGITSKPDTRRIAMATPTGFLAFGFGSGLSPRAPGTAGTVAALPLAVLLVQLPLLAGLLVVIAAFVIGIYLCEVTGRELGVHDHGGIVWDEFVGMWLVLLFVPFHWTWWLAAFVLFRVFDIIKPWPIQWLDKHVRGGFGVMLDDLLAAIYALAPLLAVLWWLGRV
jgi:phosphatidylglycerophosphatase A